MEKIDIAIIGAGVIGLSTALELKKKFPEKEIVIFESEPFIGEHSSSRNSGVLHAGIYYPKNSLKKKFCIEGNLLWKEFAQEEDISINNCGKYIIATSKDEIPDLENLFNNAKNNQVSDIRWISQIEESNLKEYSNLEKGFYSGSTSIINVSEALKILEKKVFNLDIPIILNDPVIKIEKGFIIESSREKIKADYLINAAGSNAIKMRKFLGLNNLENQYFKGCYLKYSKKFYNESLIYPIPLKKLNGLGIHTCISSDGTIGFGPNSEKVESIDYGINENTKNEMIDDISKTFKDIDLNSLNPDYAGVRSKIIFNGQPYNDFWIKFPKDHGIQGYIELCGIDSPGLTSAPAIAKYIESKIN